MPPKSKRSKASDGFDDSHLVRFETLEDIERDRENRELNSTDNSRVRAAIEKRDARICSAIAAKRSRHRPLHELRAETWQHIMSWLGCCGTLRTNAVKLPFREILRAIPKNISQDIDLLSGLSSWCCDKLHHAHTHVERVTIRCSIHLNGTLLRREIIKKEFPIRDMWIRCHNLEQNYTKRKRRYARNTIIPMNFRGDDSFRAFCRFVAMAPTLTLVHDACENRISCEQFGFSSRNVNINWEMKHTCYLYDDNNNFIGDRNYEVVNCNDEVVNRNDEVVNRNDDDNDWQIERTYHEVDRCCRDDSGCVYRGYDCGCDYDCDGLCSRNQSDCEFD
jgi:hypothetical protein